MTTHRWGGRARLVVVGLTIGAAALWPASPAIAACHAFTVEVEPATVGEGATVTVTVTRDAALAPSQVDVETVDGSAKGGADYEAVPRRTVSFSDEIEQTFTVPTTDDTEAEAAETFKLHLSNPGGCAVNPSFVVGPDAVVTVTDNDAATTTAAPQTTTTTTRPTSTTESDDSTTTTAADDALVSSTTESTASTTTEADDAAPVDDDDDGLPAAAVGLGVIAVLSAAAVGTWAWRRRRPSP